MATPKRTPFQREKDLVRIEEMYLRGARQVDIAAEIGVSRSQVQYDIQSLIKRWRTSSIRDFDAAREIELQRLNALEREYWDAWEKSKLDKEVATVERVTGDAGRDKAAKRTEAQTGNPAYLAGVQWCVEQRCKLLGLYAPAKVAPTDPSGQNPYVGASTEELRALAAKVVEGRGE